MSKTLFSGEKLRYDLKDFIVGETGRSMVTMHTHQAEPHCHDDGSACTSPGNSWRLWGALFVGAVLMGVIGTWLVWFSFVIQRQHNEADIRAACQRVMPETVERCIDTVVIQRGGMRR